MPLAALKNQACKCAIQKALCEKDTDPQYCTSVQAVTWWAAWSLEPIYRQSDSEVKRHQALYHGSQNDQKTHRQL